MTSANTHAPITAAARAHLIDAIRTADPVGALAGVEDDTLVTFAKGLAAEAILGGYPAAETIATNAYGIPADVCTLATRAGLDTFYPFASRITDIPHTN